MTSMPASCSALTIPLNSGDLLTAGADAAYSLCGAKNPIVL